MGNNGNRTKLEKILFPDLIKKLISRKPLIIYVGCAKSTFKCFTLGVKRNCFSAFSKTFIDQCSHHIETSQLICSANQLTGIYMIGTLFVKRLRIFYALDRRIFLNY